MKMNRIWRITIVTLSIVLASAVAYWLDVGLATVAAVATLAAFIFGVIEFVTRPKAQIDRGPSPGKLRVEDPSISADGHFDFTIVNTGEQGVAVHETCVHFHAPPKPDAPVLPRLIDATDLSMFDATPPNPHTERQPFIAPGQARRFRTDNPLYHQSPEVRFYKISLEDFNGNASHATVGWWGNGQYQGFPWPPEFEEDPMPESVGPVGMGETVPARRPD